MAAQHLPVFIHDLAIILMTAGATSVLFRWLKQPVLMGYVVAGFLVGPHFPWLTTITETANVKVWGEIGVIFVLFNLGLEFSFRRLTRVGGPAVLTALVGAASMLTLGITLGVAMGFSRMDALFLGGMLCVSSTTIIIKVFEETGFKARKFAQLVFGVTIVEDLIAVLLLVLLSTLAVAREFSGTELLWAALRLGFFLVLWFVVGLFVLPSLMALLRKHMNSETLMIMSVGLCLMMVVVATESGFSPALGAFVMGSLLAETKEGGVVEHVLKPLRDFFAAIFFVSVGMLFNPATLAHTWGAVLILVVAVIVGKTLAVSAGALLAGQTLKTAVRAGASFGQIGEFSFIVAGLGLGLGVINPELYPTAVAVSLISSLVAPYVIRNADTLHAYIEKRLPQRTRLVLERYQGAIQAPQASQLAPELMRSYVPLVAINLVLIISTVWFVRAAVYPQAQALFGKTVLIRLSGLTFTLLLCLPFFWGMCLRRPGRAWRERILRYPNARWAEIVIALTRAVLGLFVFLAVVGQYSSVRTLSGVTILLFISMGFLFYRFGGGLYRRIETRFLGQLNRNDEPTEEPLLPWDTHLTELVVSPESSVAGWDLQKLGSEIPEVMVAAIGRGQRRILAPRGSDVVFPQDRLSVLGSDAGVERLRRLVEADSSQAVIETPLRLQSLVLQPQSALVGKAIRDSRIRDVADGLVVGIERQGFRQLNPPPDLALEPGDRLWIVGDPDKLSALNEA